MLVNELAEFACYKYYPHVPTCSCGGGGREGVVLESTCLSG